MISDFDSLSNLYNDLLNLEETGVKMTREAFAKFYSRVNLTILFMLDGKLTAPHGLDYDGEYIQQIVNGRLITFRPVP